MRWNWQQPDWPRFAWDERALAPRDVQFAASRGVVIGTSLHAPAGESIGLTVELLAESAVTTSQIEGEILNRASIQASIQRQLGFGPSLDAATPAEQGISALVVELVREGSAAIDERVLHRWHALVMRGRTDLRDIGAYRTHAAPMRVVSGRLDRPRVHFEAPRSSDVPREMRRLLDWLADSAPGGNAPLPVLTRAGLAHLWFVSIHPYEDGNGRLARAISERCLSQAQDQPTIIALSSTILRRRKQYYDALEQANKRNEVTRWLTWFSDACIEAQECTLRRVQFMVFCAGLIDRLGGELNDRQERALRRLMRAGPEGFEGGLSARNYAAITKASPATTTRDLQSLVSMGALTRQGERRHARYQVAFPHSASNTTRSDSGIT